MRQRTLRRAGVSYERYWPDSRNVRSFHIDKLCVSGSEAFVLHDCEPKAGANFRNAEYFRIEGGKISDALGFIVSPPARA